MKTSAPTTRVAPTETGHSFGWAPLWWFAGLLLVGIPILYWATANAEPEELADRREQIQNMSPAERERLNRNFERFQKLPPEKQEALREIDEQVNSDTKLKSTLLAYDRWLHTLTPWQRQELNTADSPEARIEVVASINADRQRLLDDYEEQEKEFQKYVREFLPSSQDRRRETKRLSDDDLEIMLSVLNDDFGKRVKLRQNSLPGKAAYHFELLALAIEANIDKLGLENAKQNPLPEETVQNMLATIGDDEIRDQTEKIYEEKGARGFVGYLHFKLHYAWWNEARRHLPRQSELEELARDLGGAALTRFEETKKHDRRRAYWDLLFATRPATYRLDSKNLYEALEKLDIRQSFWRPGGRSGSGRYGNNDRDRGGRSPGSGGRGFSRPPQRGPDSRTGQEPDPAIAEKPAAD